MSRIRIAVAMSLVLLVASHAAQAQMRSGRPRIGWLTSSDVHAENVDAFRQALTALGHRDFALELRAANGVVERLSTLAAELLARDVDVIVTDGGPAAVAARRATVTVPVVIGATAGDLVRQGLVASLRRPGGNVTGFTISTGPELYGKRLEFLRQAIPGLRRVAVVWNASNDIARTSLPRVQADAAAQRVQTETIGLSDHDMETAFARAAEKKVDGIVLVADAFFWSERGRIVALADRYRLPAIYPEREFADAGGLMAYGPNVTDNFRRAAGYVDKILKGARPGDLPVEQPSTFKLVVNRKTANALGVTIPPTLLLRADQVLD